MWDNTAPHWRGDGGLNSSKFVVLNPQIGFNLLESIQEPQDRDVASCNRATSLLVLTKGG